MTDRQPIDVLIQGMLTLYSPPRGIEDREAAMKEYRRALDGHTAEEYLRAWEKIRATHKYQTWPGIPDIQAALKDAEQRGQPSERARRRARDETDRSRPLSHKIEMADRIMRGPMGRRAIEMGCPWSLWTTIIDRGAAPSETELLAMGEAVKKTPRFVEHLKDGRGIKDPIRRRLMVSIGERIMERNAHLMEFYSRASSGLPNIGLLGLYHSSEGLRA